MLRPRKRNHNKNIVTIDIFTCVRDFIGRSTTPRGQKAMWQKARLYESAALAVGAAVLFLTVAVAVHPRPGVLGDARASPMNARKVMLGMSTIKERGGVHSLGQEEEGDWTSDVSSFLASVDIPDAASLKELIVEYGHRQVQGQTLSVEAEGDGLSAEPLVAWDQTVGSDLQHLTVGIGTSLISRSVFARVASGV